MFGVKKFNRKKLKYRGNVCLNCKHPLDKSDRYCPRCSQINSTKRITIFDLFAQFFDTIFSYDSKFRKTIWTLLCKPGKITLDYTKGKRLSYTNPFRFFLSLLFTYIIIINLTIDQNSIDETAKNSFNKSEEAINNIPKDSLQNYLTQLDTLNISDEEKFQQVFSIINTNSTKDSIQKRKEALKKLKDSLRYHNAKFYFDSLETNSSTVNEIDLKQDVFTYAIKHGNHYSYESLLNDMQLPNTWKNKIAYKVAFNFNKLQQTPSRYVSFLINKLPFVIFFMIPVLSFFIWLIYSKKKFYYMEHMVFCYQTLTVLVLSYIVDTMLEETIMTNRFVSATVFFFLITGNLFYLYKAMRKFYGQSRLKTFVKYVYINTIFSILASITLIIFAGISFLLY